LPFARNDGDEVLEFRDQLVVAQNERDLESRRIRIVRRLRHVQVVVRLDDAVVAFVVSVSSSATLAITSLAFMLVDVPAPP
jgi:hypothetical protein